MPWYADGPSISNSYACCHIFVQHGALGAPKFGRSDMTCFMHTMTLQGQRHRPPPDHADLKRVRSALRMLHGRSLRQDSSHPQ